MLLAALTSLLPKRKPRLKTFRYVYQPNPFEGRHYFSVKALDQESANVLAKEKYAEMLKNQETVMLDFYPTDSVK